MDPPRFRITVVRMMVLVAGLAAILGAFRAHPSLGSFVAFVVVVGLYRAFAISDRCRDAGKPLSSWESILHFGCSILVAVTILSVSSAVTLAAVVVPAMVLFRSRTELDLILRFGITPMMHYGYYFSGHLVFLMLMSICLGGYVASLLRTLLWPSRWVDRRLSPPREIPPIAN